MHWTNDQILKIAMEQSAVDANCWPGDFLRDENVVVLSRVHAMARKYLDLPLDCNLISYGNNIVATVSERCRDVVAKYIGSFSTERCFETPNMHVLNDAMQKMGLRACFMAEYFLPDVEVLRARTCGYALKIMLGEDLARLDADIWSDALTGRDRERDVLGIGAYAGGELIGLAACSADCATMWQIGVDVLPQYRRQGVASAITSRLALEILERGRVPFYCAAWSNIRSVRNAIRSGFRPSWVELTIKPADVVEQMNNRIIL